jgi:hypothetical protein
VEGGGMIGEQELIREGRRILRRLQNGNVLKRLKSGDYGVARPASAADGARTRVSAACVAAMRAKGLLEPAGENALAVNPAGKAWYARHAAGGIDADDAFAAQHRILETGTTTDADGERISVAVNILESPLAYLFHRGLITPVQFDAGERLRADYDKAQISPHLCVDLTAVGRSGHRAGPRDAFSDIALAAKQRLRTAMRAAGPGLANVLFDICCELHGLEAVEKAYAWPRSSGKVVLRIALDRLVAHYGLAATVSRAPTRAWSEAAEEETTSP